MKTSTANLQPKPQNPQAKKSKFKADDFFVEHIFFTDYNPYDSARIRKRRFWTASQANFYSSVLFNKEKIFYHEAVNSRPLQPLAGWLLREKLTLVI